MTFQGSHSPHIRLILERHVASARRPPSTASEAATLEAMICQLSPPVLAIFTGGQKALCGFQVESESRTTLCCADLQVPFSRTSVWLRVQ